MNNEDLKRIFKEGRLDALNRVKEALEEYYKSITAEFTLGPGEDGPIMELSLNKETLKPAIDEVLAEVERTGKKEYSIDDIIEALNYYKYVNAMLVINSIIDGVTELQDGLLEGELKHRPVSSEYTS